MDPKPVARKQIATVETARFGCLEFDPWDIIWIDRGLLGFPVSQRFLLFPHNKEGGGPSPFFWLQSLDEPDLSFLVINPFEFFPDLEVVVSDEDADALGLDTPEQAEIFTLVTIPPGRPQDMRTNLAGPVVVNANSRHGRQILLKGQPPRQPLLAAMQGLGAAPAREG